MQNYELENSANSGPRLQKKNSVPTINRRVQEVGFGHRVARKKPWLNIKHKFKKLQFAKTYSKFKTDQWKKVLFTDESPYKLINSKGKQYVWERSSNKLALFQNFERIPPQSWCGGASLRMALVPFIFVMEM